MVTTVGTQSALSGDMDEPFVAPTYAGDVARAIPSLLDSEEFGLYHLANRGSCTRAEYVRAILQAFGMDAQVEEVDSSHFLRPAPVPDCEILASLNLSYAGLALLPPWQEALARYIHSIQNQARELWPSRA